ncbi:hypothetical protein N9917_04395 [Deltaproteobacteria bacterium]|nr:hypothetical protein [Deltaproteobacteria bacterium]
MKYLHEDAEGVYHLDHRLLPEVSAMFAAMSSRLPTGGIVGRYKQIVQAVLEGGYEQPERFKGDRDWVPTFAGAEDVLCEYPIHPRVQEFFDKFVLNYGHSSIMELTGQPAVYTEGISWYTAYLLFDSPLCAGQEFSTRAVRHKNWPMARECFGPFVQFGFAATDTEPATPHTPLPHPTLKALHDGWFEVFVAEVEWWKVFFSDADNRAAYGIKDKEPFRPALDRARWAIPGTISTGCCHTGHLRERARILRDGLLLAQRSKSPAAIKVWENIRKGYANALPGLSGMGLREAVYGGDSAIPGHLNVMAAEPGPEVEVKLWQTGTHLLPLVKGRKPGQKSYLDPQFNQLGRVDIKFRCSLAVSRDWHRHRTMYPWALDIVRNDDGGIRIHPAYEAKSDLAKARVPELLALSTKAYSDFGIDQMRAMLCLPLGTEVQMSGQSGLRDAIYMLELRRDAHGANFEYQAQAAKAMDLLTEQLGEVQFFGGSPIGIDIRQPMGLSTD